ncbi:MAG: V-type ATPase 116kDa subunit family protein [Candidatus Micrarchaeota archaeon]
MRKVRLIVLKSHVQNLIRDLHEAGLVDIRKTKYEGLDDGRPLPSFDELSGELLKLRAIYSVMESVVGKREGVEPKIIDGAKALAESKTLGVEEELRRLNTEATALLEKVKSFESEALNVEKVLHFKGVDFSKLNTRSLSFRVGEVAQGKMARLSESLEKMGGHNTLISEAGYNTALVVFDKKSQQDVDSLLGELGFGDLDMPAGMTTPMDTINRINAENDSVKSRLKDVRKQMAELSKANIHTVRGLIRSLEVEAERAEVASKFSASKCAYVLEGWVLADDYDVVKSIADRYSDAVIEDVEFSHHEMPPTVLDNPKVAGPLEFITNSYSLPNYFEIDPTMMYFFALPIIYGMIVGDVVYGIMSIVLGYFLLKKFEKSYIMSNVSKIWMYSGIPAIAFGLFFDEWGGLTHYHLSEIIAKWTGVALLHAPLYAGFARIENVLALIALSALAGLIHLGLGFILGAINEWNHSKKHAMAKIAWLGVEVGLTFALLPYLPSMLPQLGHIDLAISTAGLVVLGVSAVVLTITEGVLGIIEIPGLVGNILSYSRIAAIGIVGVVIAELLNEFIVPMPEQGLLAIVLLPVFFMLHLANCFVAMFESLVQGGRLNIVEFRSKFMHGGGDVFIPFALYSKRL